MKTLEQQETALDLSAPTETLGAQNDLYRVPLPRTKLYRLAGKRYRDLIEYTTMARFRGGVRRDEELVTSAYEKTYSPTNQEYATNRDHRRDVFLYKNRLIYTNGWFLVKNYTDMLVHVLNQLDVASVLEVGSGRGKNLVFLALQRPDLALTGIELTQHGVMRGREMVNELPRRFYEVAGFTSLPPDRKAALQNITFHQGNALEQPFDDKQFDLSFTCLVLEQIPDQFPQVLQEMRRVTRKYCVFIEPFAEANNRLNRSYLNIVDYFRARYTQFAEYGLEPIGFATDVPQKLTYKTGILVARVKE